MDPGSKWYSPSTKLSLSPYFHLSYIVCGGEFRREKRSYSQQNTSKRCSYNIHCQSDRVDIV